MQLAQKTDSITVEDYLTGEELSEIRHEYLGGAVYAMAGASEEHNFISGNVFAALRHYLRGGACRAFIGDVKIRLLIGDEDIFYYPDVMVCCDPRDTDRYFKRHPRVIIEVLSETTERTDRREKFLSYTRLESLEEYVLVAQDRMEVTVYRRAGHWAPEVLTKPDQVVALPSLKFEVAVATLYENVALPRR